jgi:hypothetical protein
MNWLADLFNENIEENSFIEKEKHKRKQRNVQPKMADKGNQVWWLTL